MRSKALKENTGSQFFWFNKTESGQVLGHALCGSSLLCKGRSKLVGESRVVILWEDGWRKHEN